MFTGIIQNTGIIKSLEKREDSYLMHVHAKDFFKNVKPGDSVANNGVCLSVEKGNADEASFCLMHQTIENTAFKNALVGDLINLELPCTANSFMGGHFVMGHVDSTIKVLKILERDAGIEVLLELKDDLKRYIIQRGSITLNGISLTVAEKYEDSIKVCIIPETLSRTNLKNWKEGTLVNVEVDMIGKYIENYLKETKLA